MGLSFRGNIPYIGAHNTFPTNLTFEYNYFQTLYNKIRIFHTFRQYLRQCSNFCQLTKLTNYMKAQSREKKCG